MYEQSTDTDQEGGAPLGVHESRVQMCDVSRLVE